MSPFVLTLGWERKKIREKRDECFQLLKTNAFAVTCFLKISNFQNNKGFFKLYLHKFKILIC